MRARRLRPALAAALLVSACSVDVEGAPCTAPYSQPPGGAECPDGQACGNDGRCSTRAFACSAAEAHCDPETFTTPCVGTRSTWCSAADPVCGRRETEDCAARGLQCGVGDADAGRCECPDPAPGTTTLLADATGGSPDAGAPPYPRGQASPPECRYGSLWDALQAGAATFTPITVAAMDGVFVDSRTLTVAPNVTLLAADAAHPPAVRGNGAASADPLVRVEGVVDGLRVEGGGASGYGVLLRCNGRVPEVRNLTVDGAGGAGQLSFGIVVGGYVGAGTSCGGRVIGASVTGAGTGLSLEPETWGTATVLGGSFSGNATGLRARRGTVSVEPDPATSTVKVRVAGNSGQGVVVENAFPATTALDVTLRGLDVSGNGGTGIAVPATGNTFPAAATVRIRESDVHGNFRAATTGTAGGVLFPSVATDTMTLLELSGTRVWSNGGNQVAVAQSPRVPSLGTNSCGPSSNWIGCAGAGASIANLGAQWLLVYGTIYTGVSGNVQSAGQVCQVTDPGFPAPPQCE